MDLGIAQLDLRGPEPCLGLRNLCGGHVEGALDAIELGARDEALLDQLRGALVLRRGVGELCARRLELCRRLVHELCARRLELRRRLVHASLELRGIQLGEQLARGHAITNRDVQLPQDARRARADLHLGSHSRPDHAGGENGRADVAALDRGRA